ncbi:MAG: type IV secretion system protein [Alphaproteobacteria bacterium]
MTETQNPYLGRSGFLEAHGRHVAAASAWRWTALLALAVAGISTTGLVMLSQQSKVVPYVVKVDRLGEAVAARRADRAGQPDRAVTVAQLARWIKAVRSVWTDAGAQRVLVNEAYAMIDAGSPSYEALNDYMRGHDPFARARTETVAVDVLSVLPISAKSWRIEWRETARARDGVRRAPRDYQATVTVAFNPPQDEATIRINPMGLYIGSFDWSERLRSEERNGG